MQGISETAMYGLSVAAHEMCLSFFIAHAGVEYLHQNKMMHRDLKSSNGVFSKTILLIYSFYHRVNKVSLLLCSDDQAIYSAVLMLSCMYNKTS